jgi:hypothetical protein
MEVKAEKHVFLGLLHVNQKSQETESRKKMHLGVEKVQQNAFPPFECSSTLM